MVSNRKAECKMVEVIVALIGLIGILFDTIIDLICFAISVLGIALIVGVFVINNLSIMVILAMIGGGILLIIGGIVLLYLFEVTSKEII